MSLVLWLPLIRDSVNRGTSSVIMSGAPDSLNNTGKLGGCAFFDSSVSSTVLYNSTTDFHYTDDTSFSYSMWLNHSWLDGHQYVFTVGRADTGGYGYGLCTVSANSCYFRYGSSYWEVSGIPKGTWTHIVFVKKGGSDIKIYINGSLAKQATFTGSHPTYVDSGGIGVGAFRYNTGTPANIYHYNGYINDFRIYNHALSIKEIYDLNLTMVAHYPLNGESRGNYNYARFSNDPKTIDDFNFGYSEQTGGSTRTIEKDNNTYVAKITRNTTEHSGWDYLYYGNLLRNELKPDANYTISMDVKASTAGYINFVAFCEGNATNSMTNSNTQVKNTFNANEWTHLVFNTHTISSFDSITISGQCIYFICPFLRTTSTWLMMKNIKVEEGLKDTPWCPCIYDRLYTKLGYGSDCYEHDVSGYGWHGTKNTSLNYSGDSPRYVSSTILNGSSDCINIPLYNMLKGSTAEWSFSVWFYKSQLGSKGYQTILSGGFEFDARSSSDAVIWLYSWGSGKWAYEYNKWYHLTFVRTASDSKLYINGELVLTGTSGSTVSSSYTAYIGSWHSTTSQNFDGKLSDFRIFAKALSANEIKELYNSYSHISNNNILFTYGIKENKA